MTDFSVVTPKANLVQFQTQDGLLLPGLLYEPAQKTDKILLVLHGCGSASVFYHAELNQAFAQELNRRGISYFPFNNRGAHYIKSLKKINEEGEAEKAYYGTTYEKIKESIVDIDSAIDFLEKLGYRKFYLIGYSTGANKICVYNYYQPKNKVSKYILAGGGDDTGLYFQQIGSRTKFFQYLNRAKAMIKAGKGEKMIPKYMVDYFFSYQAFYDVCNPDGDYNTFPFNEFLNKLKLAKKKLFREYQSITKPTLVVYGENDEYCYGRLPEIMAVLKKKAPPRVPFTFKIIRGADHGFTEHAKELASFVGDWLVQ